MSSRPVAIVSDGSGYVGPALARRLAVTHDLVVGDPDTELARDVADHECQLVSVTATSDLAVEGHSERLFETAIEHFGRADAAAAFTGAIVTGRFERSTIDDLRAVLTGCVEAPFNFLRAMAPSMAAHGGGQILMFTSAAGARVTPGAPLYSSARAAANMLVRNVAAEFADRNVQVNAIGTNFMDFPGFLRANRADDVEGRQRVEAMVPMRRLGTMDELAHFALPYIDGSSRFTTGQFVAFAGGWA